MKKKFLFSLTLLTVGFSVSCFAQSADEVEAALRRYNEQVLAKQHLIDTQHGAHYGFAYSVTSVVSVDGYGTKNGIQFFYGNRLSEHWMLGGFAGADFLSPTTLSYIDNTSNQQKTVNRPSFSVPIMGEVRLYLGTSRFMPYLFTDMGAAISKYTGIIFNTGIGADINFKESHTIFLNLGIGATPTSGIPDSIGWGYSDNQTLQGMTAFGINFKLGYYF